MEFEKAPQDIVAIFHAAFHPTQGSILDWSLKASEDLDLSHVEFSCLPSGLHLIERDVVYFTKDDYPGVCVFHRRKTTEEGHRGFRLSSLGILLAKSERPRPWLHVPALKALFHTIYTSLEERETLVPLETDWEPARRFFDGRKVRRADLGGAGGWKGWSAEFDGDALDTDPTIHLPHLLRIIGPSSLTLYKHILGRRRILIYTLPPVEAACILCQVAADLCYQYQTDGDESSSDEHDTPRPMKGRAKEGVRVLGMVTLNDLPKLEYESQSGRGWIACTTDAIFLEKPSYYDLLIDLRTSTPNTRPTFYASKPAEQPSPRGASHRLSQVRFTWSDVKLWSEVERLLQSEEGDCADICCDASLKSRPSSSSWTDIWRVYEDVCVICAGLWMGAWRGHPSLASNQMGARWPVENWGSIRLEGDDDYPSRKNSYVRNLGMGIEGRPIAEPSSSSGRSFRGIVKSSWSKTKGETHTSHSSTAPSTLYPSGSKDFAVIAHVEDGRDSRRARQVIMTLSLLETFHNNTCLTLERLAALLPQRRIQLANDADTSGGIVMLTPKDVMTFELGPFSGLDARFIEWLGDEYGGAARVVVRRGWRDLVGLLLGFG
ncbi:hypothetical protein WOLCODRAFT_124733 [Wolfiporia cocos MD-104 SS10]|uniref:Protein LCHN n=1 Tax=Wolfiporia cocos (strain MD-104) TaxID=742152 RepID=A0A2H3IY03_WOLCO|nr:hypothetical protein WOLCODRAFT_124733 [Wolfiporia cocos MD-104 SS10]